MTEFGVVMEASPGYTAKLAGDIEAMGFDYLLCPDTQNLSPDPYGQLTLAAANTSRLHLGTGVTNPITRDVTVTATAILTLQQESSNRAICVIGRGDSSLAHIGKSNATTEQLRIYVQRLRDYMRGDAVQRGDKSSSLRWLDTAIVPPVPIDVACTGPKTIKMAADVADRRNLSVIPENSYVLTINQSDFCPVFRNFIGRANRKKTGLIGIFQVVLTRFFKPPGAEVKPDNGSHAQSGQADPKRGLVQLHNPEHDVQDQQRVCRINHHVEAFPNFRVQVFQPEVVAGSRHEEQDQKSEKTQDLKREIARRAVTRIGRK